MNRHNSDRAAVKWMLSAVGANKYYIVALVLIQTALGTSTIGYALFLRGLIDSAVAGNVTLFWRYAVCLVGLVFFLMLLRYGKRYLDEMSRSSMENVLKERLFHNILRKDFGQIRAIHSAEWMNRLTNDTKVIANGMTQVLPNLCEMSARLITAVTALIIMQPVFSWIVIPGGVILMALTFLFRSKLKDMHIAIQERDGELRVFYQERIDSQIVIRAFGKETQTENEQGLCLENHRRARMTRNHFSNLCNSGFSLAMTGAYIFGAIYCGWGILSHTMTYGTFTAVLQLVGQVQTPFANLSGVIPQFFAMIASCERLMEVEQFSDDNNSKTEYNCDFSEFGLRNASFTYKDYGENEVQNITSVLEDFSVVIHRNEFVAFTGPSGCGKSTVLKILMMLYPMDQGNCYICIDGKEREMTPGDRNLFSYVPQGNALIQGTIREIVSFGDPDAMNETLRIEKALHVACATEFVSELDLGIDTVLGENGGGLSEGQMQRLAIARAIFADRPILLLDEATSALDKDTEEKLLENLKQLTDKTIVVVAHRQKVMEIADRVVSFHPVD